MPNEKKSIILLYNTPINRPLAVGKLKGGGVRESFLEKTLLDHYMWGHTQDSNSLSGNYFTKVYNFSFLSGIQGVHLKVKAESWIHYKHLFCKLEFTELQSSFSQLETSPPFNPMANIQNEQRKQCLLWSFLALF